MSNGIPPARSPSPGRWFYPAAALALAVITFVGFAPTYYLTPVFTHRTWPALVHVHAALFTGWVGLLIAQVTLVRARRLDRHRRLGVAALLVALAMLAAGTLTAIAAARRGLAPPGLDPLTFLVVPLGALVAFAVLLGAAIAQRRRPEWHKRLMLLATFAILTPALARLPGVGQRPVIALALTGLLVILLAGWDFRRLGRLHAATAWGGGFLVASAPLRFIVGHTAAWHGFAAWLTG